MTLLTWLSEPWGKLQTLNNTVIIEIILLGGRNFRRLLDDFMGVVCMSYLSSALGHLNLQRELGSNPSDVEKTLN